MGAPPRAEPPSIVGRLSRALLGWALALGAAVGLAAWIAAAQEVNELLDEGLRASAELLATLAAESGGDTGAVGSGATLPEDHFAWQLVGQDGRVLRRSQRAPEVAWHTAPHPGFSDRPAWRLYGLAAGHDGRMLYAAQTRAERAEARGAVAFGVVTAVLAVGLVGQLWLRARVRQELEPLRALSQRLSGWHVDQVSLLPGLGPPARAELAPVHAAIEDLAQRLANRLADEQAFSAHAAHALRTPLAGIDAQLAVAVRSAPPELADRLQRVRGAAARLQHVVAALLGLFRSADGAAALQRGRVSLAELVQRLPPFMLTLDVAVDAELDADADLVAAALLNLLDNAQRHGAHRVVLEVAEAGRVLRVRDDGRGVDGVRREALSTALAEQRYADTGGLGLMLADRVARVHGGRVRLPAVDAGFAVDLELGPQ